MAYRLWFPSDDNGVFRQTIRTPPTWCRENGFRRIVLPNPKCADVVAIAFSLSHSGTLPNTPPVSNAKDLPCNLRTAYIVCHGQNAYIDLRVQPHLPTNKLMCPCDDLLARKLAGPITDIPKIFHLANKLHCPIPTRPSLQNTSLVDSRFVLFCPLIFLGLRVQDFEGFVDEGCTSSYGQAKLRAIPDYTTLTSLRPSAACG
jgi:hypothetical protein